jgi:hypothetical protein
LLGVKKQLSFFISKKNKNTNKKKTFSSVLMAPSIAVPSSEPLAEVSAGKRPSWSYNPLLNIKNRMPQFIQAPYQSNIRHSSFKQKKKKAKEVTSVGGTTAIARTLMMQSLYLFYRTPVKVLYFFYALDTIKIVYKKKKISFFDHCEWIILLWHVHYCQWMDLQQSDFRFDTLLLA